MNDLLRQTMTEIVERRKFGDMKNDQAEKSNQGKNNDNDNAYDNDRKHMRRNTYCQRL